MDKFWKILGMVLLKLLLLVFVPTMPIGIAAGYFWGRSIDYRKHHNTLKSGSFAEEAYDHYANKNITWQKYLLLRFKLIFVDWKTSQFYEDWYTYM